MAIDGFILTQAIVSQVPLTGPAQRRQVEPLLMRETDWLEHKAAFHLLPAEDSSSNRAWYRWHLCSQIIALANTHGGALVLGVRDQTAQIVGCLSPSDPARADRVRELSNSLLTTLNSGRIRVVANHVHRQGGQWVVEGQLPLVEVNPLEVATPEGNKWLAILAVQAAPEPILVHFEPDKGKMEKSIGLFRKPGNIGELERVELDAVGKRRDQLRRARVKFDEQYARLREQADWRMVRGMCRDAVRPPMSRLTGRDELLATLIFELTHAKPDRRVLGLVGRAGMGKSALAHAAASELLVPLRGRVAVIDVSAVATHSELAAIMRAQLIPESTRVQGEVELPDGDLAEGLLLGVAPLLVSSPALVVLDGCNKLDETATRFVSRLAAEFPRLRLVYTSDHPLDLDNAEVLVVGPLSQEATPPAISAATKLFLESCAQSGIAVNSTPASLALISRIVAASGGNPLAIKATAGLLKVKSLEALAAEASDPSHEADEAGDGILAGALQRSIAALSVDSRRLLFALVFWGTSLTKEKALYMSAALKLPNPEGAIGELRAWQFLEAWRGIDEATAIPTEIYRYIRKQIDLKATDTETAIAALLSYASRGESTFLPPETLRNVGLAAIGGAAALVALSAAGVSVGGGTAGGIATAVAGAAFASPLLPVAALAAGAGYLWHRKQKRRTALEAKFAQESKIAIRAASVMLDQGQPQPAIELLETTWNCAVKNGLTDQTGSIRVLLGRAHCEAGNFREGAKVLVQDLAERRRMPGAQVIVHLRWLTIAFSGIAQFDDASRMSSEWVQEASMAASSEMVDAYYWDGNANLGRGDHERASASLQKAAELAIGDSRAGQRIRILMLLAKALILARQYDAAQTTANTLVGLADTSGSVSSQCDARLTQAEVLELRGHQKAAHDACAIAERLLTSLPFGEHKRRAQATLASIKSRLA